MPKANLKPDVLDRDLALHIAGLLPLQKYLSLLGSLAYGAPTVKDIDLLTTMDLDKVARAISFSFPEVWKPSRLGPLRFDYYPYINNRRVAINIWHTTANERPFAIFNFAYPKPFVIAMHARAKAMGLKLNQHGLWNKKMRIPITSVHEIFQALGIPYRSPHEQFLKHKLTQ